MSAHPLSAYAKSIVGAVAAVLIAGITAWQAATADGFQLVDLLPVALALAGAVLTFVVPNVPELPAAKCIVAGTLAVLTALSTGLTGLSPKADAVQVVFAIAGAFLSWYVPNTPAQSLVIAPVDDGAHQVTAVQPPTPDPVPDGGAAVLARQRELDAQDAAAAGSQMGEAAAVPLPIEAEAQQATAAQTAAANAPTDAMPAADLPPRPAVV